MSLRQRLNGFARLRYPGKAFQSLGRWTAKAFGDEAGPGDERQGLAGWSLATDGLKTSALETETTLAAAIRTSGIQMNGEVWNVPGPLDESGEERGVEQKTGGQ